MVKSLLLLPLLLVAACDGPNEKAGEERDRATAAAAGTEYKGNGPNERIGEARDRAADAASDAREAQEKALREQAHEVEAQADVQADRLEEQAERVREQAKARAQPLRDQAQNVVGGR